MEASRTSEQIIALEKERKDKRQSSKSYKKTSAVGDLYSETASAGDCLSRLPCLILGDRKGRQILEVQCSAMD